MPNNNLDNYDDYCDYEDDDYYDDHKEEVNNKLCIDQDLVSPGKNDFTHLDDEIDNHEEYDEEYELYKKSNINPLRSNLTKTPLLTRKQNDPFLRDLTACLQAKQQKKQQINESNPSNTNFKYLSVDSSPQISNLLIQESNSPKKSDQEPTNTSSFNLIVKTPVSSTRKCFLNISCEPNINSKITFNASNKFNEHSDDSDTNETYEEANENFFTSLNFDSSLNNKFRLSRSISFKNNSNLTTQPQLPPSSQPQPVVCPQSNTSPTQVTTTNLTKFKVPSFSLNNTNNIAVAAPVSVSSTQDEVVVKAKPIQLKSFNFNLNDSFTKTRATTGTSPKKPVTITNTKIFNTTSTNTDEDLIVWDLVNYSSKKIDSSTNTDNDLILFESAVHYLELSQFDFTKKKNEETQTNFKEVSHSLSCDDNKKALALKSSKIVKINKNLKKHYQNIDRFMISYLQKDFNEENLFVYKRKLLDLVQHFDLSHAKINRRFSFYLRNNNGLYKSINYRMLNDSRFQEIFNYDDLNLSQNKVSACFNLVQY